MPRKSTDFTGQRFGILEVRCRAPADPNGPAPGWVRWICRCDCGTVRAFRADTLKLGRIRSCGCDRFLDLVGVRFGMLVARRRLPHEKGGKQGARWHCECDCGRTSTPRVKDLRDGNTTSCGCFINRLVVTRGEVTPRQRIILEAVRGAGGRRLQSGLEALIGTRLESVSMNTSRLRDRGYLRKRRLSVRRGDGVRVPRGEAPPGYSVELALTAKGRAYLKGIVATERAVILAPELAAA